MSNPTDPRHDDELPPLPPPPPDPATDDDVPLALTDLDEVAEIIPAAEVIEDAVAFDLPDVPEAHAAERTLGVEYLSEADESGLPPFPPVSPAESWVTEGAEPEPIPAAAPASSSALFADPPPLASAADSGDLVDLAGPSPSASSLFGESVPDAGPASGFIPAAQAAGDSAVNVDAAPPVEPVAPASGWFSRDDIPAVVSDGIEAELAGPLHAAAHTEGSDVFASPPPPRARGDQSDVIAATSWADPSALASPAGRSPDRTSDVALTFDQPPGGSTVQEPADDLPMADDEVPEAEPLFGDSATLAHAPPLPDADATDFGAPAFGGADASSIFAEMDEPAGPLTDGSAVRIEAPGIDPTMSGDDIPADFLTDAGAGTDGRANLWDDRTEVDFGADPNGSDLFPEPRAGAGPRFELTPDAVGATDLFDGVDEGEEPSLSSAPSSIFTAPPAPLSDASDAMTAEGDAVEFSDHPDAAGGVDFDDLGGGPTYPERTLHEAFDPDDELDLSDPDGPRLPHPSSGNVLPGSRDQDGSLDWLSAAGSGALGGSKPPKGADPAFTAEPAAPVRAVRPGTAQPTTSGSVELDWVAGSSTSELLLTEPAPPKPGRGPRRPERDADDTTDVTRVLPAAGGGVNRGAGVGLLFGLLLGGGVASGVWYSGVLDQGKPAGPVALLPANKSPDTNAAPQPGTVAPPTAADARAALDSGDPARALKVLEAAGATTPDAKAARGQARLLARLRDSATVTADDAALKDARADLEAAMADADEKTAVRASVHLGLTHEVAGERAKAKEVYAAGAAKFPKAADVFQAAIDRLDATAPPVAPGATSFRLAPADAERLAVAAAFLFVQDDPAPAAEPAEAGGQFWRAVNLAAGGKYADAITAIDAAKKTHVARARALAGRGINPLTDPLEQIFPRACDDLKAYWQLRRSVYEHPTVGALARAEGVGKALDTFAGYRTERDTAVSDAKLANEKLVAAQKGLLAEQAALKTEKAALKAEKESSTKLGDDLKKAATDLTKAKTDIVAVMKDVDAAKKLADDIATKAKTLEGELATADKSRKDAEAVVAGVAAELKAAKLLPEKHAPAEVIAAAKSAASRATGPDLTSLIPPGTAAVVGVPTTTGTLVDLAARAGKLDAAAKQSAADLKTATTKHAMDYAAARTAAEAALKKATDDAAKLLTTTKADAATELTRTKADADKLLTKAKTDAATEVAKAKTDAAGMLLKLKTDGDAALTKLKTDHKTETAALEKKLADDAAAAKAAQLVAEKQFRAELANAVSPAEALPLWQAVLTDLRRPADADPALAAADRVLKSAVPDSEAAARAQTVAGLALSLKGSKDAARIRFDAAKRSPAYAANKDWARAADVGLASLTDLAAASRVVVGTTRQPNAAQAARSLGAGIAAYNAGDTAAAERALADAAWHDEKNPLPWYFLGATRFAAGNVAQARADFREGAAREAKGAVSSRVIGNAIAPIQGPVRAELDRARP